MPTRKEIRKAKETMEEEFKKKYGISLIPKPTTTTNNTATNTTTSPINNALKQLSNSSTSSIMDAIRRPGTK